MPALKMNAKREEAWHNRQAQGSQLTPGMMIQLPSTIFFMNLFCLQGRSTTQLEILMYDINNLSPVFTDAPEKRITWWDVDSETDWEFLRGKNNDADKLGLLLTGISEFPWIVDIRVDNAEEERWSTGNLVSFWYVLTTCRASQVLEDDSRSHGPAIKVTFSQQYLWEYLDRLKIFPDESYDYGGTRISEEVIRHPNCNIDQSIWDVAILKLSYGIQPAIPIVGYIPIVQNYSNGFIPDELDLGTMEKQLLVCFVASYGRNYRNSKNNLVVDFKVKHRVYLEDFQTCVRMNQRLCKAGQPGYGYCDPKHFDLSERDGDGRHWLCFRTRAQVGTVCDHDRGAPLVCGGEVYGIVVMGALGEYCNSLLMVPFVVAKITIFEDYFQRVIDTSKHRSTAAPIPPFNAITSFSTLTFLLLNNH